MGHPWIRPSASDEPARPGDAVEIDDACEDAEAASIAAPIPRAPAAPDSDPLAFCCRDLGKNIGSLQRLPAHDA